VRRGPSKSEEELQELSEGRSCATRGYTDRGESVAGSSRWYQLAERDGGGWVHSSGGDYSPRS
jgi:hypothetical protein